MASAAGGVTVVQHEVVAVGVVEERHVADPCVHDLADELDALCLELGARRGDVVDVQREVGVLLRGERQAQALGLPDAQARLAGPASKPPCSSGASPSVST